MNIPDPITGKDLYDYFLEHVKRKEETSFYEVSKPLRVFKKVNLHYNYGIANLVIPTGAVVYASPNAFYGFINLSNCFKMRASSAHVHSVVNVKGGKVSVGWSSHTVSFVYKAGMKIQPEYGFSRRNSTCASGIHFFLNLKHALQYYF